MSSFECRISEPKKDISYCKTISVIIEYDGFYFMAVVFPNATYYRDNLGIEASKLNANSEKLERTKQRAIITAKLFCQKANFELIDVAKFKGRTVRYVRLYKAIMLIRKSIQPTKINQTKLF